LPFIKKAEALKSYFGFHEWANLVHQKAGNAFVVMDEGFQNPSKYSYYTRSLKGFAYDSRYYGRTMFDIWPMEDSLQHQRIYLLLKNQVPGTLPIALNAMPAPGMAVGLMMRAPIKK
jgi:hypothetical protein